MATVFTTLREASSVGPHCSPEGPFSWEAALTATRVSAEGALKGTGPTIMLGAEEATTLGADHAIAN